MISLGSFTKKEAIALILLLFKEMPNKIGSKFKFTPLSTMYNISLDDKGYVVVKKESE